jgi:hypothetical protein
MIAIQPLTNLASGLPTFHGEHDGPTRPDQRLWSTLAGHLFLADTEGFRGATNVDARGE